MNLNRIIVRDAMLSWNRRHDRTVVRGLLECGDDPDTIAISLGLNKDYILQLIKEIENGVI